MMQGYKTNARQIDPTRTVTLRRSFEAQFYKRFRKLKGLVLREIVKEDGFGLKTNRGRFEFPRAGQKVSSFMDWLREAQRQEIIGISEGVPMESAANQLWANLYVRSAYQQGLIRSGYQLREQGGRVEQSWIDSAFFRPIHADRAGLIYTRTYSELEGITEAMDQQISRVLAQGMLEGRGPMDLAREINDRIDKIGLSRARMLARTEVVAAHAEAQLNSFEEAGIEGVEVEAEIITAANPCPECASIARSGTYTIEQARGMLPVHPNCRCAWIPKVINPQGINLR